MKISIVIPVYNVAPYLRECLDSVLSQTFKDWEAICVDDGSSDKSSEILDEYADRDSRIRVIHRKNEGVSRARNVGISGATGDHVTFLDGDDVYDRNWLAEAQRLCEETKADLVRMKATMFEDGVEPRFGDSRNFRLYEGDALCQWGWRTFCKQGWSWVSFVRRSCLDKMDEPFPVGMAFMEDNIFSLRVLSLCHTAVQSEYGGYGYRQRNSSACAGMRSVACIERLFEEVLALPEIRSPLASHAVGMMLCEAVMGWRKCRVRLERRSLDRLYELMQQAADRRLFALGYVPLRWRWGFAVMMKHHRWLALDGLIAFQKWWGRLRLLIQRRRT